jgi:alkanesulfonate monooxygenase SsuD/methylene tetrahydromethanopterin reductase-like flavin-dependent oxidoreductase (luciferase family)
MEFGVFLEFDCPEQRTESQAFDAAFELVDAAEDWGLDAVWLAEVHVAPGRSVLSSPLTIASAIAARTSRVKIGTAVQILPLCHPLRLAEDTATIDQISHGRLIMGVGRSGFPRAYDAYGVPYTESRERFTRALRAELGLGGILVELNCGNLIPPERVKKSLQLLCEEVMPDF